MIDINPKYQAIGNDTRYYVITGGRASGKSFSVNIMLVLLTYEANHTILFTRYTLTSAYVSIIPEFIEKIELLDKFDDFHITKDEIINIRSGSKIVFKGIKTSSGDQTANLKSITGVTTWVLDEAEELTDEETFDKIDLTIRETKNQNRIILILNPTTKEHWIYQRFFEDKGIQEGIHTTYQDNLKNLSKSFLKQIEELKIRRPLKYKHAIMGGWLNKAEGVIFNNWKIGEFKKIGVSVFGQDYGFSNDPTTLIETNIDTSNKLIYLRECYYLPSLTTSEITRLNIQHAKDSLIVADSAEPRLISEIRAKGCNVKPSVKGQGSVTYGISLLQDYDLVISEDSINLVKELNNYSWLEKKSNTPIDKFNHLIDAVRYAVSFQLKNPNRGKYIIQ